MGMGPGWGSMPWRRRTSLRSRGSVERRCWLVWLAVWFGGWFGFGFGLVPGLGCSWCSTPSGTSLRTFVGSPEKPGSDTGCPGRLAALAPRKVKAGRVKRKGAKREREDGTGCVMGLTGPLELRAARGLRKGHPRRNTARAVKVVKGSISLVMAIHRSGQSRLNPKTAAGSESSTCPINHKDA